MSGATKSKLVQAIGPRVVVRRGRVPRPRGPLFSGLLGLGGWFFLIDQASPERGHED